MLPGWPKSVLDDFNWPSPVMVDLDLDTDLEIVIWANIIDLFCLKKNDLTRNKYSD